MKKKITLREQNKIDKKDRIQKAARRLFVDKGFDKTTTREIAELAHVGLATLFLYASDKRDLLFLVYNDDLDELNHQAFEKIPDGLSFIQQLLHIWGYFYRYYATIPDISRALLKELIFFSEGKQCARFQAIRMDIVRGISELVEQAKARGEIHTTSDSYHVAEVIFYLFALEVRVWLVRNKHPDPQAGLERLAQTLEILMAGLDPKPGALGPAQE